MFMDLTKYVIKWTEEVEKAVNIVEEVVEMVEKVAEGVEKVADNIGDHLPEGTVLGEAASFVEDVAKQIAMAANLADEFIDKVFLSFAYRCLLFVFFPPKKYWK